MSYARLVIVSCIIVVVVAAPASADIISIRDSIGPDNTWTDGNKFAGTHLNTGTATSGNSIIPFEVTAPGDSDLLLTHFEGVAGGLSQVGGLQPVFSEIDYFLRVYGTMDEAKGPGLINGTLGNFSIDLAGNPAPFGESFSFPFIGPYPTFLLEFDLEPLGLMIPAGETRVFGIQGVGDEVQHGALAWIRSNDPLTAPDWQFSDFQGNYLLDEPV